ncbi:PP2C family protein-serine/threonine phosphatase, partial [Streptomyces chiangmaiensis]
MVPTDAMSYMQEMVVEAVHRNSGCRDGLMDHVIDGPASISKTCLLRAMGRSAQKEIEAATNGRQQNMIPVVHITTSQTRSRGLTGSWSGSYLGPNPEPKNLAEGAVLAPVVLCEASRHRKPVDRYWGRGGGTMNASDDRARSRAFVLGTPDFSDQGRSRRDLELLHAAAQKIGSSLDVTRTAQDLADVLVPSLGDQAWVLLAEAVFEGDEPPKLAGAGQWHLRQTGVASASGVWPTPLLPPGAACPPLPDGPHMQQMQRGETVRGHRTEHPMIDFPELVSLLIPERGHSYVSSPLFARGLVLGVVVVWRTEQPHPFDKEDADLLAEIASRAALSVDNARRYTREHHAVLALQQRLLPPAATDTAAAETVGFYRPAGGGAEISGDWFDVIPLPSLRVSLVVGDVAGHGLHATATMGRLRTGVQTLADLELDPAELLTH